MAGLYNLNSKDFIEIKTDFIVGKGEDSHLSVAGGASDKQAQFLVTESGFYILNLDIANDVLVNMKRLPERFFVPLEDFALITIGEDSFIFSHKDSPKTFKVKEVISSYENSTPSDYDPKKLETANLIQDEIDSLSKKLPSALQEIEGPKEEIEKLLKERKLIDQKIKKLKETFDAKKGEISPILSEIKAKKDELKMLLQDLSKEKGESKLELDL